MTFQDLSGRGPKRTSLIGWGAITLVALVIAAIPLTMYARGQFDETMTVSATTDQIGDGLTSGGDVKFRGLIVGRVDSVVVTSAGKQRVTMSIDSEQAPNIPSDVSAAYAPSNILGVTGIELKPEGGGGRLRDGEEIAIGSDATDVSVTTLLRDVGTLSETLTGTEVSRTIDLANRIVNAVQPLARQGFDLLNLAASRQQMPLARFIRILGESSKGTADLSGPFVGVFTELVDNMSEYTDQRVVDGVTGTLRGLVDTVSAAGGLVSDNSARRSARSPPRCPTPANSSDASRSRCPPRTAR